MTRAASARFVAVAVAVAMFGSVCLLSRGSADERPRRGEPIPVSELTRRSVVGWLGHDLGKIVTIEGTVADGSLTRAKADEGATLLRVRIVNSTRLKQERVFHFEPSPGAKADTPPVGSAFRYVGYETGGYSGTPADAFEYIGTVATTMYGFKTSFVVLRDEKNRK